MKTYDSDVMRKLITKLAAIYLLLWAAAASAAGPEFGDMSVDSSDNISGCPAGVSDCTPLASGAGFLQQEVTVGTGTEPVTYIQTIVVDASPVVTADLTQQGFADLIPQPPYVSLEKPGLTIPATGPITHIAPSELGGYTIYYDDNSSGPSFQQFPPPADNPASSEFIALPHGTHYLTWTFPEQDGLHPTLYKSQFIRVIPQVSFGPAEAVSASEGSEVTLTVYLNGEAPSYPVTIPYLVSGNASNPDDHNAVSGELVITSGITGEITFTISDDNIHEATEEIVFSLQPPHSDNAALGRWTNKRVIITEARVPPQLDLTVSQFGKTTRLINNEDSTGSPLLTTATVSIHANNPSHRYLIDWGKSDNAILAASMDISDTSLLFDPDNILPGIYKISVEVKDLLITDSVIYSLETLINIGDHSPPADNTTNDTFVHTGIFLNGVSTNWLAFPTSRSFGFIRLDNVDEPPPPASTFSTSNVDNDVSPFNWGGDMNTIFGTASSLDTQTTPEVEVQTSLSQFSSITTGNSPPTNEMLSSLVNASTPYVATGLILRSGSTVTSAEKSGNRITLDDIISHGGADGGPALYPAEDDLVPSQIVDFEVAGLVTPGQTVSIVIPQESPIPENAIYRKYLPYAGWVTFTEDANNSLASARKVNGICPEPDDTAYTTGLTAGDNCVQLSIEDGGPNDADQQANTIIKDPGGVASVTGSDTSSASSSNGESSGSGGGSGLYLLWLLALSGLIRHRKATP